MLFKQSLAAVAVTLLLASCGGGGDPVATAATPDAAISSLRAQARALRATPGVTAEQAAEQLMDAAERAYPAFFPGHKASARFDAFSFRHYPETGVYLGVVVTSSPSYSLEGVYVMGGSFGSNPAYQGQLTHYITPTPVSSGGTGNGCFDLALMDTEGTRLSVGYTYSGPMTGNVRLDTVVGGLVAFEGRTVRETNTAMTGTTSLQGQSTNMDQTGKTYATREGSLLTEYGMVTTYGSSQYHAVYDPPYVNRQNALAVGESFTAQLTTTTTWGSAGTATSKETRTTRYVGQESITVPAGTYTACRFETSSTSGTGASAYSFTYTNWFMVGRGIHLQSVSSDGTTSKASSITLNGARL